MTVEDKVAMVRVIHNRTRHKLCAKAECNHAHLCTAIGILLAQEHSRQHGLPVLS